MSFVRQLFSFGGVGLVATGIQYLILVVLAEFFGVHPVVASTVGYVLSAFLNYYLNYQVTFASKRRHIVAGQRFVVVAIAGSSLNAGIMYLLVELGEMNYLIAQVLTTGVVFFWNFFLHRHFTFGATRG